MWEPAGWGRAFRPQVISISCYSPVMRPPRILRRVLLPAVVPGLLLCVSMATLSASSASTAIPGSTRHVLVIGIDGCIPDGLQAASTPNLDALAADGVITYYAFAGGDPSPGDPTHQATSSGPGWSSICTGVWVDRHGVSSNGNFASGNFVAYPHFFKHVHDELPGSYLSSIVQWHPINESLLDPFPGTADYQLNAGNSGQAVENAAVDHLGSADPTVLFLHFDDVDHAGHSAGYSVNSPAYLQAIEETDAHIGAVLSAVQARPNYATEDWLVVATTDHGGIGTGHGGHSVQERRIWILTSGGTAPAGVVLPQGPGQTAVPPTVLKHLDITIDPWWGLESLPFGLPEPVASHPVPSDGASSVSRSIQLSWFAGADALSHAVYFGVAPGLGAAHFQGQQTQTSFDPGELAADQSYYWRVDTITSGGTVTGEEWSFTTTGEVLDDIVLALDLEGDLQDHSGRHNDGVGVGGVSFTSGASGAALDLDGSGSYVTLGTPADLLFGGATDFTVTLWVKAAGWSSDPALISNKN